MKQGVGEERTLVGTIFEGSWDKGRKHGRGVRKMIFGSVDEQVGGSVLLDVYATSYHSHAWLLLYCIIPVLCMTLFKFLDLESGPADQ